jgi:hypothetical protein
MASIIEMYNADKKLEVATTSDKTPYYSEGTDGKTANLVDEKSISELEKKLSTARYGQGVGNWGAVYSDASGKNYSKLVKKD